MYSGYIIATSGADGLITGLIEGLDAVKVERAAKGFVEEFDCRDDICVGGVSEREILERGNCLGNCIALLPVDGTVAA